MSDKVRDMVVDKLKELILDLMKTYGMAGKSEGGKGWTIYGQDYPTQNEFRDRFMSDAMFANEIRQELILKLSKENGLLQEKDEE